MADYRKVRKLGSGTYGTVYLAVRRVGGKDELVAVKRLYTEASRHNGILGLRELEMAMTCSHPNLASAVRVLHDSPFRSLSPRRGSRTDKFFLEFDVALCDLDYVLTRPADYATLDVHTLHAAMVQVSRGLAYLHDMGIMHRDIKPDNVLLYEAPPDEEGNTPQVQFVFKLADLGAAKPICERERKNSPKLFYVEYRAPELLLKCRTYRTEPDMWALGCLFVEIGSGKSPFPAQKGISNSAQLSHIVKVLGTSDALITLAAKQKLVDPRTVATSPMRPRGIASVVGTKRAAQFDAPGSPIRWEAFLALVARMLDTDPCTRMTCHQVLAALGDELSSSDTGRISGGSPRRSPAVSTTLTIRDCPCRTRALALLKECGLTPLWYDHCVDVVNRLTYDANYAATRLVIAVVSLVTKYWLIELAPSLRDLLPTGVGKGFTGKALEDFEQQIVRDGLEYRIFRPLLSEVVAARVPREAVVCAAESLSSNGRTIEELALELEEHHPRASE
jgi:serine/threonine protein kinase